jgi:hypothetical protein
LAKGPPVRRLMRILFGFVAAMLAAAVSEVLFALPLSELFSMDKAARIDRLIEMGGLVLSAATHSAIFSAGFAPFAILIAEWQRLCHWTYSSPPVQSAGSSIGRFPATTRGGAGRQRASRLSSPQRTTWQHGKRTLLLQVPNLGSRNPLKPGT